MGNIFHGTPYYALMLNLQMTNHHDFLQTIYYLFIQYTNMSNLLNLMACLSGGVRVRGVTGWITLHFMCILLLSQVFFKLYNNISEVNVNFSNSKWHFLTQGSFQCFRRRPHDGQRAPGLPSPSETRRRGFRLWHDPWVIVKEGGGCPGGLASHKASGTLWI